MLRPRRSTSDATSFDSKRSWHSPNWNDRSSVPRRPLLPAQGEADTHRGVLVRGARGAGTDGAPRRNGARVITRGQEELSLPDRPSTKGGPHDSKIGEPDKPITARATRGQLPIWLTKSTISGSRTFRGAPLGSPPCAPQCRAPLGPIGGLSYVPRTEARSRKNKKGWLLSRCVMGSVVPVTEST